jgi:hypothetical protein
MTVRMHHFFTKENNHSRTKAKPTVEPDNSAPGRAGVTPGRACIARGARMGVGGGQVESRRQCMYTYTAPQKNSVLKGLLPRPGIKSYRNQRGLPLILWKLSNQSAFIVNPISFHCVP